MPVDHSDPGRRARRRLILTWIAVLIFLAIGVAVQLGEGTIRTWGGRVVRPLGSSPPTAAAVTPAPSPPTPNVESERPTPAAATRPPEALTPAAPNPKLVRNGSFEEGTPIGSFLELIPGATAIAGWRVDSGTVDYIGSFFGAADGMRSVDLSGQSGGVLSQRIATVRGQTYRLSFKLAGNPAAGPRLKDLRVSAGSTTQSFQFDIAGKSAANVGWLENGFEFEALDTTTELRFESLTNSNAGPALDDVRVTLR